MLIEIETTHCPRCGLSTTMTVDAGAYEMWEQGALIQDAFVGDAYLTPDERETLMSGYHRECRDLDFVDPFIEENYWYEGEEEWAD